MTTVLPALLKSTLTRVETANDLPNQRESLILKNLATTTSSLAQYLLEAPGLSRDITKEIIIEVLVQEAAKLSDDGCQSFSTYQSNVSLLISDAEMLEAGSDTLDRIDSLRFKNDIYVYTAEEIEALIEQKQQIILISSIFKFCKEVQELAEQPDVQQNIVNRKISQLNMMDEKAERLGLQGKIQALFVAKEHLNALLVPKKFEPVISFDEPFFVAPQETEISLADRCSDWAAKHSKEILVAALVTSVTLLSLLRNC